MKKVILSYLLFYLINIGTGISSEINDVHDIFFLALVNDDRNAWETAMKQVYMNNSIQSGNQKYHEYLFGYISWCIRDNDNEKAIYYLDHLKKIFEKSILSDYEKFVFQSAIYSYVIMLNKANAIRYGPKCIKLINKALKMEPDNPIGYIQKGNICRYMPAIFGGSTKKALQYFQKAEQLFRNQYGEIKHWLYLYLLCSIYECCRECNQIKESKQYQQQIHRIAPELSWIF